MRCLVIVTLLVLGPLLLVRPPISGPYGYGSSFGTLVHRRPHVAHVFLHPPTGAERVQVVHDDPAPDPENHVRIATYTLSPRLVKSPLIPVARLDAGSSVDLPDPVVMPSAESDREARRRLLVHQNRAAARVDGLARFQSIGAGVYLDLYNLVTQSVGIACSILLLACTRTWIRKDIAKTRLAQGQCPACGYARDASPGPCPECGSEDVTASIDCCCGRRRA